MLLLVPVMPRIIKSANSSLRPHTPTQVSPPPVPHPGDSSHAPPLDCLLGLTDSRHNNPRRRRYPTHDTRSNPDTRGPRRTRSPGGGPRAARGGPTPARSSATPAGCSAPTTGGCTAATRGRPASAGRCTACSATSGELYCAVSSIPHIQTADSIRSLQHIHSGKLVTLCEGLRFTDGAPCYVQQLQQHAERYALSPDRQYTPLTEFRHCIICWCCCRSHLVCFGHR